MSAADELSALCARLCGEAGALLRARFGAPLAVGKKGPIDLVTDADRAAEALILEALAREAPGAPVLAEESGQRRGEGELEFLVDPLDGTTNFARGIPHYATTIAAIDRSGLCAGAVYDPSRDELFVAARGRGATLDDAAIAINRGVALDDAVLATGLPYDVRTRGETPFRLLETMIRRSRAVRRFGSAALDLAWVACGRYDGYFELGLKPWDLAAGLLLVREAGGAALDYAGGEAAPEGGEAIAAEAPLARAMVAITSAG